MSILLQLLRLGLLVVLLSCLGCLKESYEDLDFVRAVSEGITISDVDEVELSGRIEGFEGTLKDPAAKREFGFLLSDQPQEELLLSSFAAEIFVLSRDFTANESFTRTVDSLSVLKTYVFRAYIQLGERIHYGNAIEFNLAKTIKVDIQEEVQIINDRAQFSGILDLDFQGILSDHGFVYSKENPEPLIGRDSMVSLGETNDDGLFSTSSGPLEFNTDYFVRAFAVVNEDEVYSEPISFSTRDGWRHFATINLLLSGAAAAAGENGIGYISGCSPPCRETVESLQFSKLWALDPLVHQNDTLENFSGPPGRDGGISFMMGGKIYFGLGNVTGSGTNYPVAFYQYDPGLQVIKKMKDFPGAGRKDAVAFVLGDSVAYVGTGSDGSLLYDDFWRFQPDIAEGKVWQLVQNPLPVQFNGTEIASGRSRAMAVNYKGEAYVGTGSVGPEILRDLYQFHPESESWSRVGSGELDIPNRMFASAFVLNEKAYIGLGQSQGAVLRDLYEFDPATGAVIESKMALPADITGSSSTPGFTLSIENRAYIGRLVEKEDRLKNATEIWQYIPKEN